MPLERVVHRLFLPSHAHGYSWRAAAILSLLIAVFVGAAHSLSLESMRDFTGYWLAHQLLVSGQNPYDPMVVEEWRRAQDFQGGESLLVWNPPLTSIVLAPVFMLPPVLGYVVLVGGSAFAALAIVKICWNEVARAAPSLPGAVVLAALSLPVWFVFFLGQITLVLTFVAVLVLKLLREGRHFLAGVLLSVLTVKVHLFFLLGGLVLLAGIRRGRFHALIGAGLGIVLFSASAELLKPGIHSDWLGSDNWPPRLAGNSLVHPLRQILVGMGGADIFSWLLVLLPLAGGIVTLVVALRHEPEWSFTAEAGMMVFALTPLVKPFGYIFDDCILLPALTWLFAEATTSRVQRHTLVLLFWVAFAFLIGGALLTEQTVNGLPLFWYTPLLQIAALYALARRQRIRGQSIVQAGSGRDVLMDKPE